MDNKEIDKLLDMPEIRARIEQRNTENSIKAIESRFCAELDQQPGTPEFEGIPMVKFSSRCLVGMMISVNGFPVGWRK